MPDDEEEFLWFIDQLVEGVIMPDTVEDYVWSNGQSITDQARQEILTITRHMASRATWRTTPAKRKAMKLLRRHLTSEQKRQLRNTGEFYAYAPSGRVYRLRPVGIEAGIWFVQRHGKNFYAKVSFCLHDQPRKLPPPDVTLAHLLLISCDEEWFIEEANPTPIKSHMWDGEWRRQLNAARQNPDRQREHEEAVERVRTMRERRAHWPTRREDLMRADQHQQEHISRAAHVAAQIGDILEMGVTQ